MDDNIEVKSRSNILTQGQTPQVDKAPQKQISKLPQRRSTKGNYAGPKITRSQSLRDAPLKFSITDLVEGGRFQPRKPGKLLSSIQERNSSTGGGNPTEVSLPALRAPYNISSVEEQTMTFERFCPYATTIARLERKIVEIISAFPTVMLQQARGPNFIANWNWSRHFQKHQKEAEAAVDNVDKHKIIRNFYNQVTTAGSILHQISQNFQNGLRVFDPNPDSTVNEICHGMEVLKVGARSRSTVSDNMIPHMREIFQNELYKQQIYSHWTARVLTDAKDIKVRNALVAWVLRTSKHFYYAAETAHLAVHYIDAYLGIKGNKIATSAWMLLAIAALYIAGKLEEPKPARVQQLIHESHMYQYKKDEVYWMEKRILEHLKFDMYPPLPSVLVQLVIFGGSLVFPNINQRKLAMDLARGILHRSLLNHELVAIAPADKAKVALEIAVEFIFYQYNTCVKRDMSTYVPSEGAALRDPGQSLGELMLILCTETFTQKFMIKKVPLVIPAVACMSSPVRNVKV